MAKMTLDNLKKFNKAYVDASKQAGTWVSTSDNLIGFVDKIGKQITLEGEYGDKLPELEGDNLPLGRTIEEYFIDLTLPSDFVDPSSSTFDPSTALKPYFPSTEQCYYNYTLGRKFVATSEPFDNFERGCLDSETAANIGTRIIEKLTKSYQLARYGAKRQLLGNMATKAVTAGRVETLAVPSNAETGEAFIKSIKNAAEIASDTSENTSLGGYTIGAAPSLTLYVKQGIMSSLEVDTLAGAFHDEKLAIPATIKVIPDFGDADANIYAILVDPRGVKLHNSYSAVRDQSNAVGDYINFIKHYEDTGFISKATFVKVYKKA